MISYKNKIKYIFKDLDLLNLALTHKSASQENNERLEFLGDSIISFYISEELYRQNDEIDEGKLTQLRAKLVNRSLLNSIGKRLNLDQDLILGKGEKVTDTSILGNTLEALVGAIYIDGGIEAAKKVLNDIFDLEISNLKTEEDSRDSKSKLQEILQKKSFNLPNYSVKDRGPEKKNQRFKVTCRIEDLEISSFGTGKNRKIAEQKAAAKLLKTNFYDE